MTNADTKVALVTGGAQRIGARPVTPGNRADRVGDELATTSDQWSRRIEVATDLPLMQHEVRNARGDG